MRGSRRTLSVIIATLVVMTAVEGLVGVVRSSRRHVTNATPADLWGQRFVVDNASGSASRPIELDFKGDGSGVAVGCNTLGFTWKLDRGHLAFRITSTTLVGCYEEQGRADAELYAILRSRLATETRNHGAILILRDGRHAWRAHAAQIAEAATTSAWPSTIIGWCAPPC